MALIDQDPPAESNGPDRNRFTPGCWQHHTGTRTGIKDYCCCCDPCLYRTVDDSVEGFVHCCRCNPRVIVAKYTPTSGDSNSCVPQYVPMLAEKTVDSNENTVVHYQGSLVGRTIHVWISTNPIPEISYDSYYACRWTVYIPELDVAEEIEIDHETVTCLGVPSIEITGVTTSNGGCTGTITLDNFEMDKVEFQHREFPESFYDGEGTTVDLYQPCGDCVEVARFLCVSGVRHQGDDGEWVEFEWDTNFEPHEVDGEYVHGRWSYTPPVPSPFVEYIYLVSNGDYCELQFDFESPYGRNSGELIAPQKITECSCNIKQFVSAGTPQDPIGFTIRAGRCSCWKYLCGTCRCVPRYLCGIYFDGTTVYTGLRFTWDSACKCWVSSGGADIDGYSLGETITVSLGPDEYDNCQLTSSTGGDPVPISCGIGISGTFSTLPTASDPATVLLVTTAFSDCEHGVTCTEASPCDPHPQVLMMSLDGYNDPYEDEPGITDECKVEVPLLFWEEIAIVGDAGPTAIEINCGYKGYHSWSSAGGVDFRTEFDLTNGVLEVRVIKVSDGTQVDNGEFSLDYEYCDPYIGEHFSILGLTSCLWGDATIQRVLIEITE